MLLGSSLILRGDVWQHHWGLLYGEAALLLSAGRELQTMLKRKILSIFWKMFLHPKRKILHVPSPFVGLMCVMLAP